MTERLDNRYARLGEEIAVRREEQGLSQRQLAAMINQTGSNSYVSRVEKGKVRISLEQVIKIADALDVDVNKLIDF